MNLKFLILVLFFSLYNSIFSQCLKADIIFMLDWSGSEEENGGYVTGAAIDFVNSLNLGPSAIKVGIIPFESSPMSDYCVPLTSEKEIVINVLLNLSTTIPSGSTGYLSSMYLAQEFFENSEIVRGEKAIRILILISDGEEFSNEAEEYSKEMKSNGCAIWCIGTGTDPIEDYARLHLISISNGPDFYFEGTYFMLRDELMALDLCP